MRRSQELFSGQLGAKAGVHKAEWGDRRWPGTSQYTTSQKSQGESQTAQQAHCAELEKVQDWVLKSTKSQINVRICMIIENTIGRPHEDRGKGELWSPLFIADSSGRRPEV